MVNWSLNQEESDSSSTNASFGNADNLSKSPRRRVSRRKSSAVRLDGQKRVQKVVKVCTRREERVILERRGRAVNGQYQEHEDKNGEEADGRVSILVECRSVLVTQKVGQAAALLLLGIRCGDLGAEASWA